MVGKLYIVGLPIGNDQDLTLRAQSVVTERVGLVAAEDTRRAKRMFPQLRVPVLAYHDHSDQSVREKILKTLKQGTDVALVCDAGTPCIADPGYRLVSEAIDQGTQVTPVPGASAVTSALSISGLPTDQYHFVGYLDRLPMNKLSQVSKWQSTLVGFVPARLLSDVVARLAECYASHHRVVVARELTKTYEEVWRGSLQEFAEALEREAMRGEVVLMLPPPEDSRETKVDTDSMGKEFAVALIEQLCAAGVKHSHAVAAVAKVAGLPKNALYKASIQRDQ